MFPKSQHRMFVTILAATGNDHSSTLLSTPLSAELQDNRAGVDTTLCPKEQLGLAQAHQAKE